MKTKFSDLAINAFFKTLDGKPYIKSHTEGDKWSTNFLKSSRTTPNLSVIPLYNVPVTITTSFGKNIQYRNEHGNLHRLDGPANEFPDGTKDWYINGVSYRDYLEYLVAVEDYNRQIASELKWKLNSQT